MIRISIIKSDARMARLAELLRQDGLETALFAPEEAQEAADFGQVIVLPLKGPGPELFAGLLERGQELVCGQDFLQREDFSVLNAIPTVEGALQIALEQTPHTLHSSLCCVLGYGRIGKLLADALGALGAQVSVAARKPEDFAWIRAKGYTALHSLRLEGTLGEQDVIFNTAPHMLLPHARLAELKKSCVLLDLASAPGGIDLKAAQKLGLRAQTALGLPGRIAPESAAVYLRDTLFTILQERNVLGKG